MRKNTSPAQQKLKDSDVILPWSSHSSLSLGAVEAPLSLQNPQQGSFDDLMFVSRGDI